MDRQLNSQPEPKAKWRRWTYRTFVITNVVGIIVAIPLIIATLPLLKVWWDTRSEETISRRMTVARAKSILPHEAAADKTNSIPSSPIDSDLKALTNQLGVIGNLNERELGKIVAQQYGAKKAGHSDPAQFDEDSAVLHKISRSMVTIKGKEYYCYNVDLVDENGNHKTHADYFEKPGLDYERGMATLELVNNNPQLKKIYDAFAHVLAEKSNEQVEKTTAAAAKPVVRLEPESEAKP